MKEISVRETLFYAIIIGVLFWAGIKFMSNSAKKYPEVSRNYKIQVTDKEVFCEVNYRSGQQKMLNQSCPDEKQLDKIVFSTHESYTISYKYGEKTYSCEIPKWAWNLVTINTTLHVPYIGCSYISDGSIIYDELSK